MNIRLHKNATTTPKTRAYIQSSSKGIKELADELGISVSTVRHWRSRDDVHDRPHTRKNLLASLSEAQEAIVVELRRTLRLPLDDLLAVTREFIHPELSCSAVDRCLRRNGIYRLADLPPLEPCEAVKAKPFKAYEPGYIHIDYKYLLQMPDESKAPFRIRKLLTDNDKAFTDRLHRKAREPSGDRYRQGHQRLVA